MTHRHVQRRRGFTLVELLVVIGIIAVLIGILLPTLNRARAAAQQSVCLSNLRQLSIACASYAADCRGLACPSTITGSVVPIMDTIDGVTGKVFLSWNYEMVDDGSTQAYSFAQGYLGKYLKTEKVLECPAMVSFELPPAKVGQPLTSYGMAVLLSTKASQVRMPSETAMFGDAISLDQNGVLIRPTQFARPGQSATFLPSDTFMGRHANATGGVGFCDGHAEMIPSRVREKRIYSSSMTDQRLAQVRALHIGPCIPPTMNIDYNVCTSGNTYAVQCGKSYDYYFWSNKMLKDTNYVN